VRGRREGLSWAMFVILFLACMTIQGVGIVNASPGATVYVDPPISTGNVSDTFSVYINVTDIEYDPPLDYGLYWWEFTLAFNPALLQVPSHVDDKTHAVDDEWAGNGTQTTFWTTETPVIEGEDVVYVDWVWQERDVDYTIDYETGNITFMTAPGFGSLVNAFYRAGYILTVYHVYEGPFLKDTGHPTGFSSKINNTAGNVKAFAMLTPPYPPTGAVGSGVLCNITFQVKAEGETPLHFERTILKTVVLGEAYPIPHTAVDGYFRNIYIIHDLAVTDVTAFPTSVLVGESISINATVRNEGEVTETFDVKAYHNFTEPAWSEIDTITLTDLAPEDSETVSFTWIPSTIHKGAFFILKVEVPPTPVETDITDNTREFEGTVFVGEAPEASFEISPAPPYYVDDTLAFNASSSEDPDGTIVSYFWDFGDNINATETDPVVTHIYTASGIYTVNLTVTDNHNFTDIATRTVTVEIVTIHDVAVTNVTVLPTTVTAGANVSISVTVANEGDFPETLNVTVYANEAAIATKPVALSIGDSTTLTFEWNTTDIPPGTYVVSANASVVDGETDILDNKHIDGTVIVGEVNTIDHQVVVGGFTFHVITKSNSTVSNFELIHADKKLSFDVTGLNGTVGFCNVTIPKDLLNAPLGQWTVLVNDAPVIPPELLATENDTHTSIYFTYTTSTHKVEIIGAAVATPPVATFTYSPADPVVDETVTLNASTSYDPDGTIVSYAWDFGDGTNGAGMTITHAYDASGTYTVTLTVTDDSTVGLVNTTVLTVTVYLAGPSPTPFPWTVAIAVLVVAVIAVAGVAVYMLKIRKPRVATAPKGVAASSLPALQP